MVPSLLVGERAQNLPVGVRRRATFYQYWDGQIRVSMREGGVFQSAPSYHTESLLQLDGQGFEDELLFDGFFRYEAYMLQVTTPHDSKEVRSL